MTKLKKLKKMLKQSGRYNNYKKNFVHKDMRLLFSYTALTFVPEIRLSFLVKEELKLIDMKHDDQMFVHSFSKLADNTNQAIDWKSFGKFIWYIYQTSTYWKGKKTTNIFTKENFVEQNEIKRTYFYNWIESIPTNTKEYNLKIKKIMKRVF